MLSTFLAKKIIDEVKKFLNEDLIITGVDGIIMASSDDSRVGTFHEGALVCAAERRKMIIYKEDEQRLKGVRNGLNLPIFFLDNVIGVIGITGEPDRILPYGELLRKMTELLVQESYYSEQLQWRSRGLEAFVYDWLQADSWSRDLMKRAEFFNIDLTAKRQFIFIQLEEFIYNSMAELTRFWDDPREQDFFIHHGNNRVLLIHSAYFEKETLTYKLERLLSFMNTPVRIGIGRIVESTDVAAGYAQAERALAAAAPNTIVFEEDLRLDYCLQDINPDTRDEFVKRILQNVRNNKELLDTFHMFFKQNMSLKATAGALQIHINTLHYRMKKIEMFTGLDLKHFPDIVSLYLALRFLDEHTKK
ncbi:CdaR family transcriptional regulator [Domibacillus epiphyticus]|uniref:CdaR family transcriptional regulator n=1 Tax=Domibacillus epiphyticus TaxID=1714355 RepID=UPI0009F86B4E|nr:sugar diacid recognition domain-containing protein [Domibacillus epiphyticus]